MFVPMILLLVVVAPIWIAADGVEACFLNLSTVPESGPPTLDDLRAALSAAGVSVGVDDGACASLCEALANGDVRNILIPLARGTAPVLPQDAMPAFSFEYDVRVGKTLPDGG